MHIILYQVKHSWGTVYHEAGTSDGTKSLGMIKNKNRRTERHKNIQIK